MASRGTLETPKWKSGSNSAWLVFEWSATKNASNNTSTISYSLKTRVDWSTSGGHIVFGEVRLTINGAQEYYRPTSDRTDNHDGDVIKSGTFTVTHNASGAGSFTAKVEAGIYVWTIGYSSDTQSFTLDPITVYKLTTTAGSNSTITVNRTSSGYGATGNLSNNATLYYGDKLKISFAASTGYQVSSHTVNGSAFTSGNTHTVSGNVAVVSSASALASTVSATNANIGGTSTITVRKGNSSYAHSLYFSFGSSSPVTGYIKSDGTISSTEVKYTNTSVSFRVPTSFYAKIPSAKSGTCTITCKTYSSTSSSTQVGSSQTCTFTATAAESSCKPTVSGTVVDTNTATTALTGNSSKLVRYKSTATATISATAKNSATISSEKINNSAANSSHQRVFTQTSVSSFTFQATDSRGYSNSYTVNPTIVPYVLLTANPVVKRTSATGSSITLSVSGNVFVGNFGAQTNSVEVWCRYKLSSDASYPDWDETAHKITSITYGSNTYRVGTVTLNGTFDYQESYDFNIWVGDKLSVLNKYVTVSRGVPVFDWGKDSFRVNGDAIGTIYGLAGATREVTQWEDLDDYVDPGVYGIYQHATARTLAHCPSIYAGTLRVWSANGKPGNASTDSWQYRFAEYTDLSGNVWRRYGYSGEINDTTNANYRIFTWGEWTPITLQTSDHVVEQGTSGIWTYRKWQSGLAECWARRSLGALSITSVWDTTWTGANLYYATISAPANYPFDFVEYPAVNITVQTGGGNAWGVYNHSDYSTSNPGSAYVIAPKSMSIGVTINYHVVGRWATGASSAQRIRLMTYNVGRWNWGESTPGIAEERYDTKVANLKDFLGSYDPDIICMQEYYDMIDRAQTKAADSVLFGSYPYEHENGPRVMKSKYELTVPSGSDARYARFTVGGKSVGIVNAHLESSATGFTTRKTQLQNAIAAAQADSYAIICGDFNAYPDEYEELYQIATDAGFTRANGNGGTWYQTWFDVKDRYKGQYPSDPENTHWYCDNILVRGGIGVLSVTAPDVLSSLNSDHVPLIAELSIPS